MLDISKKLRGKTVVVTRPISVGGEPDRLGQVLASAGAIPMYAPVIEFCMPEDVASVRRALENRPQFNCLVFVSRTGAHFFRHFLEREKVALESFDRHEIVAIGPGTQDALAEMGLAVNWIPPQSNSRSLAQTLLDHATEPFLIIRADRGSQDLAESLKVAGRSYVEIVLYCSRNNIEPDPAVMEGLANGDVDWITVTSSAIAEAAIGLYGGRLRSARIATIGPAVSAVLETAGYQVAAQAKNANFNSLVEAMIQVQRHGLED